MVKSFKKAKNYTKKINGGFGDSLLNSMKPSTYTRKAEKYGSLHFISFLSATLSRLAYFDDNNFLKNYNSIMGPVISEKYLTAINSVPSTELDKLLNDGTLFNLTPTSNDAITYNDKLFLDFIKLNMPQRINQINGENSNIINNINKSANSVVNKLNKSSINSASKLTQQNQIELTQLPSNNTIKQQQQQVKYISIGWSNYGEIFVVADKKMPNTLFLIFRGTYSAKTASIYSKPSSIMPLSGCKENPNEKYLYGIFKVTTEMIHTIIEAMRYLANNFLKANAQNSVKIFTTGHSLGGAMCTIFAYLWMKIRKTSPYNMSPYNVLAENIICISLGSPRCMNSYVAKNFCDYVKSKNILYLRITTNGDPVPMMPLSVASYVHPCSNDAVMRKEISEACVAPINKDADMNVNYNLNLDCLNYKGRAYVPNPLAHSFYLDIRYLNALNLKKFAAGVLNVTGNTKEVQRFNGKNTVCRLISGCDDTYQAVFFVVDNARMKQNNGGGIFTKSFKKATNFINKTPLNTQNLKTFKNMAASKITSTMNKTQKTIGIKMTEVIEDTKMNKNAFDKLMKQSYNILVPGPPQQSFGPANSVENMRKGDNSSTSIVNLCPMSPPNEESFVNPFEGIMPNPNLSCGSPNKTVNNTSSAPLIK